VSVDRIPLNAVQIIMVADSGNFARVTLTVKGENAAATVLWKRKPTDEDQKYVDAGFREMLKLFGYAPKGEIKTSRSETVQEHLAKVQSFLGFDLN